MIIPIIRTSSTILLDMLLLQISIFLELHFVSLLFCFYRGFSLASFQFNHIMLLYSFAERDTWRYIVDLFRSFLFVLYVLNKLPFILIPSFDLDGAESVVQCVDDNHCSLGLNNRKTD